MVQIRKHARKTTKSTGHLWSLAGFRFLAFRFARLILLQSNVERAEKMPYGGNSQLNLHDHPASLYSFRIRESSWPSRSCGDPELSSTMSAQSSLSAMGIWELSREDASSRDDPSRFMRRCSWISEEQYTTITFPINFHSPPSINNGTSSTHTLSPRNQHLNTSQNIAFHTAGCTIPFNIFRFSPSLNTIEPNLGLLRYPSGRRISRPKTCTIRSSAGEPGWTTCRAMRSASMMGTLYDFRRVETVDFPVAIPPVRPTTSMLRFDV